MDEREMTSGVIPLRHASLPGHVKLPRRYERAAMGSSGVPVRLRKISLQPGMGPLGERLSDRLQDLTAAMLWVKQELIMLRQHDILLKRQFFHIQHSIQSLLKHRRPSSSGSCTCPDPACPDPATPNGPSAVPQPPHHHHHHHLLNGHMADVREEWDEGCSEDPKSCTTPSFSSSVSSSSQCSTSSFSSSSSWTTPSAERKPSLAGADSDSVESGCVSDFPLETYVVRASSSVTVLNGDSEEEDGEGEDGDTFCPDFFPRPRTSSMRTSRDMAALARRRGSKELI